MKKLSLFVALALLTSVGVGVAPGASTKASGAGGPAPRLGDWKSTGNLAEETTMQVQRVKTETQVDNGKHVTVTREDYFRLTDFNFSDYIAVSCNPRFDHVRIEPDGKFHAERDHVTVHGDVLSATSIKLVVDGRGCRAIQSELHRL
jgi:hypothetical protein